MRTAKFGAMVLALGTALPMAASADTAETRGGIKIRTDDGRFEGSLGGRIHFDGNWFVDDEGNEQTGGTFFRRTRITLAGKAYDWEYKFENDFAAQSGTTGSGWRDMYLATAVGPGKVMIGQFKPFRGMEELTSSNELTVMERGFSSASGILGQQFVSGVGYLAGGDRYTAGLALYTLNGSGSTTTEGAGASGRVTFAPVNGDAAVVHLGGWASNDNPHNGATIGSSSVRYAGRLGPSQAIGATVPNRDRTLYGAELAGAVGPFFVQGEYVLATLDQGAAAEQEVQSYYVMASWHVTGESKPYKGGVFRSVKPAGSLGAIELVGKYDFIENKDLANREVTATTVGVNYYVNPNVRFMLNYVMGENDLVTPIEIDVVTARAQFSF